ncbi:MAG: hypothetical protein IPP61_18615 [Cytophagaceae bacterium]|nr:hypothetical protein [Cytophagaceae bacterium]MBK9936459.1 hypothetical protein [Cytophagaceae bacterium]MBL0300208.1 hypothetical protein [Cytophagaceae bacterium]MBL0327145.1 hypothetical protein [Cytophagaceae bacterium]
MKSIILFLSLAYLINCQAQEPPKEYFVQNLKFSSSDSKIDVNSEGDTILISYFKENNLRLNTINLKELIYKGTPFFMNGWFKGSVLLEPNGKSSAGLLGYNLAQNKLYVSLGANRDVMEIAPYEFEIEKHVFRKYNKQYAGAGDFYYEKLTEGHFELFRQNKCMFYPKVSGDRTGYEASGDGYEGEFLKKTEYYVNWREKMQLVSNNFKIFEPFSKEAKKYASENHLSLKKPAELIKVVNFVNEIAKKTPPENL